MRRVPFYPLLITVLVSIGGYLGCDPRQVEQQVEQQIGQQLGNAVQQAQNNGLIPGVPVSTRNGTLPQTAVMAMPARSANTLIIGSFNVQRLGPSKLQDTSVMQYLADIIRHFDVIAIQEVTSKDENTVPTLLRYVNAGGARYRHTISRPSAALTLSSMRSFTMRHVSRHAQRRALSRPMNRI